MTTPRDIDSYGGAFVDESPVRNPTTQQSAAYANRLHEDVAQMTNTTVKFWVTFTPTLNAAPYTLSASGVLVRTHFGTGPTAKPTIDKTATGRYTMTFASTYTDGLDESEATSNFAAFGHVQSASAFGHVQCTVSGAVVSIAIVDLAAADTDLGGTESVLIGVI